MSALKAHPAQLTIQEGIAAAWNFLTVTWKQWLPFALGVTGAQMVMAALVLARVSEGSFYLQSGTGQFVWVASRTSRC